MNAVQSSSYIYQHKQAKTNNKFNQYESDNGNAQFSPEKNNLISTKITNYCCIHPFNLHLAVMHYAHAQ